MILKVNLKYFQNTDRKKVAASKISFEIDVCRTLEAPTSEKLTFEVVRRLVTIYFKVESTSDAETWAQFGSTVYTSIETCYSIHLVWFTSGRINQ